MSVESMEIGSSVASLGSVPTLEVGMPAVGFPSDLTSGFSGGGLYPASYLDNLAPYPSLLEPSVAVANFRHSEFSSESYEILKQVQDDVNTISFEAPSYIETLDLTIPQPRGLSGIELSFGKFQPATEINVVEPKSQVVDVIGSIVSEVLPKLTEISLPNIQEMTIAADRIQLKKVEAALQAASWDVVAATSIVTKTAQEMRIEIEEENAVKERQEVKKTITEEKVLEQTLIAQVDTSALKAREYALKTRVDQAIEVSEDGVVDGKDILKGFSVSMKQVSELVKGKDRILDSVLTYDGTINSTIKEISDIREVNSRKEGYTLINKLITAHLPVMVSDNLDTQKVSEAQIHEVLYGKRYLPEVLPLASELPYLLDKKPNKIEIKTPDSVTATQNEVNKLRTERRLLMIKIEAAEVVMQVE